MSDLASLGLRIESQEADTASARMNKMKASAVGLENATDSLATSTIKGDGAIAAMLASIDRTTKEMLELSRLHQQAGGAALVHAGATEKLTNDITQASTAGMYFAASFKATQTNMGGANAAIHDYATAVRTVTREIGQADAHMAMYRAHIAGVGTGLKLTAQDSLNFTRQMADVGVTAAMGMNPFMIALQQGPQLFEILQVTAIRSGLTIRQTMMATGAAIWTALAPVLPIIAAIAVGAAAIGAAWGLATRSMSSDVGDLTKTMGLNQEQVEKLKEANVSTTITAGDAWRGLGTTIKQVFQETFGDKLKWVGERWNDFLNVAGKVALAAAAGIGAGFIGTFNVIRNHWRTFPAVLGDAAVSAANIAIRAMEGLVNTGIAGLNKLIVGAKALSLVNPAFSLARNLGEVGTVSFGEISNPFKGAAAQLLSDAGAEYVAQFERNLAAMTSFYERWMDNAEASGRARIRKGLGDDTAASGSSAAKGEAEKFVEVLNDLPRVDLQPIRVQLIQLVDPAEQLADKLRLINALAQDSARGMASAFGETGRSMGDLLTTMTAYESRLAAITVAYNKGQLDGADADRERAHAQVNFYGDTLAAAKTFFAEGSDGYRALQAAEAAWRVFSFAMSVQAMAQQAAETSASVAQSGVKAGASATAGAAKMFEQLGPYAFPVVAAMIALLAGLGMKGKGGGGGSASPSLDGSVAKSQGYSQQADATQSNFAASVAQKVDVRVSADRDGIKAYIEGTAAEVAAPMVAQGMAAAAGATRAQVMSDLDKGRTYSRGG